jgi:hypothetical protein
LIFSEKRIPLPLFGKEGNFDEKGETAIASP